MESDIKGSMIDRAVASQFRRHNVINRFKLSYKCPDLAQSKDAIFSTAPIRSSLLAISFVLRKKRARLSEFAVRSPRLRKGKVGDYARLPPMPAVSWLCALRAAKRQSMFPRQLLTRPRFGVCGRFGFSVLGNKGFQVFRLLLQATLRIL